VVPALESLSSHRDRSQVEFESDDYNTGFEFQLNPDRGRDNAFANLLWDKDSLAWFRCFNREMAAVWAAVTFAEASVGAFQDETGSTFPTREEALAFAGGMPVHGAEFFSDAESVSLFTGADEPRTPGPHRFEPLPSSGAHSPSSRSDYRSLQRTGRPFETLLEWGSRLGASLNVGRG
jgi:hypothetical protein